MKADRCLRARFLAAWFACCAFGSHDCRAEQITFGTDAQGKPITWTQVNPGGQQPIDSDAVTARVDKDGKLHLKFLSQVTDVVEYWATSATFFGTYDKQTPWLEWSWVDNQGGTLAAHIDMFAQDTRTGKLDNRVVGGSLFNRGNSAFVRITGEDLEVQEQSVAGIGPRSNGFSHKLRVAKDADGTLWFDFDGLGTVSSCLKNTLGKDHSAWGALLIRVRGGQPGDEFVISALKMGAKLETPAAARNMPAAAGLPALNKPRPVRGLAFSPDGRFLAAAYGGAPGTGEVVAWDLVKREPRCAHREDTPILAIAYSPKGDLLAIGTYGNNAKLLDAATGGVRRKLIGHQGSVRSVAFSPNGKWLATASYDDSVKLWDVASGEVQHTLMGNHSLRWVGFSPDGKWLASIAPGDHLLKLWRLDALEQPPRQIGAQGELTADGSLSLTGNVAHAAFSPDSRVVACADLGGASRLYDVGTGREIERLNNVPAVHWVALSADGKWLAGAPASLGLFVVPQTAQPSEAKLREIDALIDQFQDDDLSKREAASRKLADCSSTAAARASERLASPDAEVRDRCRMLLDQMYYGDFDTKATGLNAMPECLAFSPDSNLLACGDWNGTVKLWQTGLWKELPSLTREDRGPPVKLLGGYPWTQNLVRTAEQPEPVFQLPHAAATTLATLAQFRQALKNETWEKAFLHLDQLMAESPHAVVPDGNGFTLSLQSAIFESLAQIPAAGKNAYRLFYDVQARGLWAEVQHEQGSAETEKLSRLATIHLFTSVGDLAANRLGDNLFEQGDMVGAVDAWQRILKLRADSPLPVVELLVKTATAMARAGRQEELATVKREIERRNPGDSMVVGGKKISAAECVKQLNAADSLIQSSPADDDLPDLTLPDADRPLWQFQFGEGSFAVQRNVVQQAGSRPVSVQLGSAKVISSAAVVGRHLYGNLMGCDFALDLSDGKLLWSGRRFQDVLLEMRQGQLTLADCAGLAAVDDQLWTIARGAGLPIQQRIARDVNLSARMSVSAAALIRRDPQNGQELWNSSRAEALKQWLPMASPLMSAGKLYVFARRLDRPDDLYLLAVRASDGQMLWSNLLGAYQIDPQRGTVAPLNPIMWLRGTRLYVDTQANEVLEIQTDTGAIRWGYFYGADSMQGKPRSSGPSSMAMSYQPNLPVIRDGILYLKAAGSSVLHAVRLDNLTVAWRRTAPVGSVLSGIDNERIYLSGDEFRAYDLQTKKLVWNIPAGQDWPHPLFTRHRAYQLTSHGLVELDSASGEVVRVFRGADSDSAGGRIFALPKMLITISNHAITAYPLPGSTAQGR